MSWPQGDTPFDPEPMVRRARELWQLQGPLSAEDLASCEAVLMTLGEYVESLPQAQRGEVARRLLAVIQREADWRGASWAR